LSSSTECAKAIVQAYGDDLALRYLPTTPEAYGSYLPQGDFPVIKSRDLLEGLSGLKDQLQRRIVIVGGGWHTTGYGRSDRQEDLFDTHVTPLGPMGGVFIHANFVEDILDFRVYKPAAERFTRGIEIALIGMLVLMLVLELKPFQKVVSIGAICFVLFLLSYIAMIQFGFVFDFFSPLVGVFTHSRFEREWDLIVRKRA
jgi:CHASE2 domain-containing sensor protein